MNRKINDDTLTLADLGDFAEEHLPEDYRIEIVVERGSLGLRLYLYGCQIDVPEFDDDDLSAWLLRAVNVARVDDGLEAVDWDGSEFIEEPTDAGTQPTTG